MGIMIAIGIVLMSGLLVGLALPHGPASQSQTLLLLASGLWSTIAVAAFTLILPYVPLNSLLGFVPLPAGLMAMLIGPTLLYVCVAEIAKKCFYSRIAKAGL